MMLAMKVALRAFVATCALVAPAYADCGPTTVDVSCQTLATKLAEPNNPFNPNNPANPNSLLNPSNPSSPLNEANNPNSAINMTNPYSSYNMLHPESPFSGNNPNNPSNINNPNNMINSKPVFNNQNTDVKTQNENQKFQFMPHYKSGFLSIFEGENPVIVYHRGGLDRECRIGIDCPRSVYAALDRPVPEQAPDDISPPRSPNRHVRHKRVGEKG